MSPAFNVHVDPHPVNMHWTFSHVDEPEKLSESLTNIVINSVIQPLVSGDGIRNKQSKANLYELLKSTSSSHSSEELGKILGKCPTTKSMVLLEGNMIGSNCSSCRQILSVASAAGDNTRSSHITHVTAPSEGEIQILFVDHQKFMFFFERVAELYICHRSYKPSDVHSAFSVVPRKHRLSSTTLLAFPDCHRAQQLVDQIRQRNHGLCFLKLSIAIEWLKS